MVDDAINGDMMDNQRTDHIEVQVTSSSQLWTVSMFIMGLSLKRLTDTKLLSLQNGENSATGEPLRDICLQGTATADILIQSWKIVHP